MTMLCQWLNKDERAMMTLMSLLMYNVMVTMACADNVTRYAMFVDVRQVVNECRRRATYFARWRGIKVGVCFYVQYTRNFPAYISRFADAKKSARETFFSYQSQQHISH